MATTSYSANQTTATDQAGHAKAYTTDASGRLALVVEDPGGLNYSTYYNYYANNALYLVTQGSQQRIFFTDTLGRVYATTEPENGTVNYTFDSVGNAIARTDARGVITCNGTLSGSTCSSGYDSLNRPTAVSYSDGTPSVSYSYDNGSSGVNTYNTRGRLLSVANSNSTTTFSNYDPLGRIVWSGQTTGSFPTRSFSYGYNLFGDLTSETYPSGRTITSAYDGAERPYSLSGTLGSTTTNYVTQSFYWPNGIPWYFVRGGSNNVWHVNAINSRMQVPETYEAIGNNNNSTQMLFVSCPNWGLNPNNYGAYDICPHAAASDNGNLQGYTEYHGGPGYSSLLSFSQTLGYDNVNRLTSATDNGGWSRYFGYDQYGNMAPTAGSGTNSIPLAGNTPTAFNSSNQISGPTGTTYDAAGNQTLVNGNAVGYDAENRATTLAGFAFGYVFDGLGQRVQKTQYSHAPTAYVYDAFGQLAAEYAGGTTWTTDYIRWGSSGALIATENAGGTCTTCYFGYDHLGSMRLVMDQSANVIGRHDFLPYGEEVPASTAGRNSSFGPSNDSVTTKFTGQLRDSESGMDYFNARNFTAPLGRFMSPDPGNAGASLTDPQTWNGYAYARGNPLRFVDPSGMSCVTLDDGSQSDDGDGLGCAGAGVGAGDPNDPGTLNQGQINVQVTSTTAFVPSIVVGPGGDAGAYTLLNDFLSGKDGTWYFQSGSGFSDLLLSSQHVQFLLNGLRSQLNNCQQPPSSGTFNRVLGALSPSTRLQIQGHDFSNWLTGGLMGNLAASYLGSYNLYYTVSGVNIDAGTAQVNLTATNVTSWASATRNSVSGYNPGPAPSGPPPVPDQNQVIDMSTTVHFGDACASLR